MEASEIKCEVCGKVLPPKHRAIYAAGKWCHAVCFPKLNVPVGTPGYKRCPANAEKWAAWEAEKKENA